MKKNGASAVVKEERPPYPAEWQRLPAEELQQRIDRAVRIFNDVNLAMHRRLPASAKAGCKYNRVRVALDTECFVPAKAVPGKPGGKKTPAYKQRLRIYEACQGPISMWVGVYEYPDSEKPTCTTIRISFSQGQGKNRNVFCAEYKKGSDVLYIRYCIIPETHDWTEHVRAFVTNSPQQKKGAWK